MKRLLIGLLAISFVLTLLPETQANAPDAPSAISRKLLGLQVGKSSYPRWRRNGEDQYGFTFVPRKYQGDFRNVCLYIEWKDYDKESTDKNGNKTQYYNYKKYQKIFDDLVAAGVESIGVCFCPFLPDWVCERIYNDFKDPKRTWEPWLKGWANRYEPKDWWDEKARRINLSYTKNWWSRSLFRFESGSFKQVFEPEENRDKKGNVKWPPFYRNAAHLALPAYEEMVEDFATRFGKYVDFWEPWDEPGWGLNFAPAGVEYDITTKEVPPSKRVCGRSRFSGWPGPYRSVEDGTWIAGDAQKVQASCYETVHEVYGKHAKDKWPSPCVLLASLVGDDMLLNVSPAFFSKEENANVQGNTSSLYYYRDNLEYKDLSLKVSSSRAVVCERPLYVNLPSGYSGGGDSAGSSEPSSQWYFAEGTTREGFEETLNLFNPSKDKITVDVTFMFGDGRGTQQLQVEVNGGCRKDLSVNDRVGSGQDVSVSLKAADNRRFYAERTVNFNYKGVWNGTHCSVGATAPSTTWYFAEGTTRTGFEEWLCIQNPNDRGMYVTAQYMTANGSGVAKKYSIGANQRLTLEVAKEVGANQDVAVRLTSSKAFIAERPMYFSFENKKGGDCILGATSTSKTRYFAEGCTYGWAREFICIQNPADADIVVTANYLTTSGQSIASRQYLIHARSRNTIDVNADAGGGKDVSVCLSSEGEFIAERPFYFDIVRKDDTDNVFNGGSVCMGSESPAKSTVFAAGGLSAGTEEWVAIMNPNDRPAAVTMTFTDTAGKSWQRKKSVPARSRWTYRVYPFTAGIYSYCDAVGVHLFNLPTAEFSKSGDHKTWASTYRELNSYLGRRTPREVAVTSCGWPHAEGSAEGYRLKESGYRTRSYQAAALKDGIAELLASGCRKFWVFQDIDPRTTADAYFGLFSYSTHRPFSEDIEENDAWWVYRGWQYEDENGRVFPDYQKKKHKP